MNWGFFSRWRDGASLAFYNPFSVLTFHSKTTLAWGDQDLITGVGRKSQEIERPSDLGGRGRVLLRSPGLPTPLPCSLHLSSPSSSSLSSPAATQLKPGVLRTSQGSPSGSSRRKQFYPQRKCLWWESLRSQALFLWLKSQCQDQSNSDLLTSCRVWSGRVVWGRHLYFSYYGIVSSSLWAAFTKNCSNQWWHLKSWSVSQLLFCSIWLILRMRLTACFFLQLLPPSILWQSRELIKGWDFTMGTS